MIDWIFKAYLLIGLCAPFTQWELHASFPDGTGWATRWPDKAACERELANFKAHRPISFGWHEPGERARCIPPWEEGVSRGR